MSGPMLTVTAGPNDSAAGTSAIRTRVRGVADVIRVVGSSWSAAARLAISSGSAAGVKPTTVNP